MKRSEMVEIIADYLHHAMYQIGNDKFVHADKILQKMEDNGMLPPVFNWNEGSGLPSYMVQEWEPEYE